MRIQQSTYETYIHVVMRAHIKSFNIYWIGWMRVFDIVKDRLTPTNMRACWLNAEICMNNVTDIFTVSAQFCRR